MIAIAKVTATGKTIIPQDIRTELKLGPGDLITWDVGADGKATVCRVQAIDLKYLHAAEGTLGEWADAADEAAYREL